MSMPASARAIIIKDECILVIRRVNGDRKYMVTPGGRIELNESREEALFREIDEETTVKIKNPRLVFIEDPNQPEDWGLQYIYLCDYASGRPQLRADSEEVMLQAAGHGSYEPMWFPIDKLPDLEYPFKSERLVQEILTALQNGFPKEPKKWILG